MSEGIEDQIRLGLRLLADEVQAPAPTRKPTRPSRRAVAIAIGLAVLIAGVAFGTLGRSSAPAPGPRFVRDAFDYRAASLSPGGLGFPSTPGLAYSIPTLSAVAASSARDAWIVGSGSRRSGAIPRQGVAWHWDGSAWRDVAMPKLTGDVNLSSVATLADGETWAVGSHSERADYRAVHALIEHWDGSRWRTVRVPRTGTSNLSSVSASGQDNVWAVGESLQRDTGGKFAERLTRPLLLHWDGSVWSVVAVPWVGRPGFDAKVVTTGPTDVWVVAGDRIGHWDGSRWRGIPAPFGPYDPLAGFTATSSSDAWAVGSYRSSRGAGGSQTLAAHWNGRTWQIAPTPNLSSGADLEDVVAVRPNDVWAIGGSQSSIGGGRKQRGPFALFEHWDGRNWKTVPGVMPPRGMWEWVSSVGASEDGSAWAVGGCYFDNVIARWNGSAWAVAPHPPDRWDQSTPHSTCGP